VEVEVVVVVDEELNVFWVRVETEVVVVVEVTVDVVIFDKRECLIFCIYFQYFDKNCPVDYYYCCDEYYMIFFNFCYRL